jgi:ribosomal protein S18 acetylase RimI-like enzyme
MSTPLPALTSDRADRNIVVRELHTDEWFAAVRLIAGAMRDDPIFKAVFGADPRHRLERLQRFFTGLLPALSPASISAWEAGQLVGLVAFIAPRGLAPAVQLRIAYRMLTPNIPEMWRLWRWVHAADKHLPPGRHCVLGAVAVDVGRQRQGIGSAMLRAFCQRMDEHQEDAFLETDKYASVRFYERFGFAVTATATILGTQNWWMYRAARQK